MEEENKKTTFLFLFSTYLIVFLLKFRLRELVGCGIKFRIQRVPTWHTFDGPHYPKNKKDLKKCDDDIIMECNSTSNELSRLKFEQKHREICWKYKQKVVFFFSSSKFKKYYFIILTIILLILFRRPILSWNFL